mgnify:CR=1 FL=1
MLPPVEVPAAVLEPALKIIALVPVLVTAMSSPNVRLPDVVLTLIDVNAVELPIALVNDCAAPAVIVKE